MGTPRSTEVRNGGGDRVGVDVDVGGEVGELGQQVFGEAGAGCLDAHVAERSSAGHRGEHEPGRSEGDAERCGHLQQHRPVLRHHDVGAGVERRGRQQPADAGVEHLFAVDLGRAECQAARHPRHAEIDGRIDGERDAGEVADREGVEIERRGRVEGEQAADVHDEIVDRGGDREVVGAGKATGEAEAELTEHIAQRVTGSDRLGELQSDLVDAQRDELGQAELLTFGYRHVDEEPVLEHQPEVGRDADVADATAPAVERLDAGVEDQRCAGAVVGEVAADHEGDLVAGRREVERGVGEADGGDVAEWHLDRADGHLGEFGVDERHPVVDAEPQRQRRGEVLDRCAVAVRAAEADRGRRLDLDAGRAVDEPAVELRRRGRR